MHHTNQYGILADAVLQFFHINRSGVSWGNIAYFKAVVFKVFAYIEHRGMFDLGDHDVPSPAGTLAGGTQDRPVIGFCPTGSKVYFLRPAPKFCGDILPCLLEDLFSTVAFSVKGRGVSEIIGTSSTHGFYCFRNHPGGSTVVQVNLSHCLHSLF